MAPSCSWQPFHSQPGFLFLLHSTSPSSILFGQIDGQYTRQTNEDWVHSWSWSSSALSCMSVTSPSSSSKLFFGKGFNHECGEVERLSIWNPSTNVWRVDRIGSICHQRGSWFEFVHDRLLPVFVDQVILSEGRKVSFQSLFSCIQRHRDILRSLIGSDWLIKQNRRGFLNGFEYIEIKVCQ